MALWSLLQVSASTRHTCLAVPRSIGWLIQGGHLRQQNVQVKRMCIRHLCADRHEIVNENSSQAKKEKAAFREIFTVPTNFISVCRRIQYMKLVTFTLLPFSYLLAYMDPDPATYVSVGGFTIVSLAFFAMGKYVQRVGYKLYVCDITEQVKIASMNFRGKRKDHVTDIDNVTTTANKSQTKLVLTVNEKNMKNKYFVYLNMCRKEQRNEVDKYFGDY